MGTLMLILLGNGVVANVLRKRSKAEDAGWMVIAVMAGVFTAIACGSSDAHLNPAVTMGIAVSTGQFAKFAPYLVAQLAPSREPFSSGFTSRRIGRRLPMKR